MLLDLGLPGMDGIMVIEAIYDPDPNLLRVHMAHIRHKLERDPSRPVHFITDSGMGYRFENDE